jgi:hypothetical protein
MFFGLQVEPAPVREGRPFLRAMVMPIFGCY